MKKYLFFIVCIIMSCTVKSQKNMESYLEIDFQDYFQNDTVSLSIDKYLVFANMPLNSDFSTGITDIQVKIYKQRKGGFVKYGKSRIKIGNLTGLLNISVSLNGNKNEFKVDIAKGKYIGLSKKGDNNLRLYQSKEPFEYE